MEDASTGASAIQARPMQNREAVVGSNSSKLLFFLWLIIIWHLPMTHLPHFFHPNDGLVKMLLLHFLFQVLVWFVQEDTGFGGKGRGNEGVPTWFWRDSIFSCDRH